MVLNYSTKHIQRSIRNESKRVSRNRNNAAGALSPLASFLHCRSTFATAESGKANARWSSYSTSRWPREDHRARSRPRLTNCFLSLDGYLGKYTPALAHQISDLLNKYQVTARQQRSSARPSHLGLPRRASTIGLRSTRYTHRTNRRAQTDIRLRKADPAFHRYRLTAASSPRTRTILSTTRLSRHP